MRAIYAANRESYGKSVECLEDLERYLSETYENGLENPNVQEFVNNFVHEWFGNLKESKQYMVNFRLEDGTLTVEKAVEIGRAALKDA